MIGIRNKYNPIIFTIVISLITGSIYTQEPKEIIVSENDLIKYKQLNEQEKRLIVYKDSDETLLLKLKQLAFINYSRKKYRKQSVQLDILASRVANKIAYTAATKDFMGHFNLRGESPYHRYAFAGGVDHITENASSISSNLKLTSGKEDILFYMKKAHSAFMAEKAPNDGHKQNCIDSHHNYVGIGIALYKNQFRYYEEFIDRYISFKDFTKEIKVNQQLVIPTKPLNNLHLHIALAYYEKFPSSMSTYKVNRLTSYNDYTKIIAAKILPWQLPQQDKDGYYHLPFTFTKKGLYYIQLFLDDKPYKSGKTTTNGKIQASGIVIIVN
jgi:uncharacterized protein YkwD